MIEDLIKLAERIGGREENDVSDHVARKQSMKIETGFLIKLLNA